MLLSLMQPLLLPCRSNLPACAVMQAMQRFVVQDLSNFYLDIAKDRLYVGAKGSSDRRACQTVLAALLQVCCCGSLLLMVMLML